MPSLLGPSAFAHSHTQQIKQQPKSSLPATTQAVSAPTPPRGSVPKALLGGGGGGLPSFEFPSTIQPFPKAPSPVWFPPLKIRHLDPVPMSTGLQQAASSKRWVPKWVSGVHQASQGQKIDLFQK